MALALAEQIIALNPDEGTMNYALKMREHLKLPMAAVLEKLWPHETVTKKMELLGINRQNYYGWMSGRFRPGPKLARRLANLTGYSAEEIRGRLPAQR